MAELEDIPPTVYPDGSVIGNFDAGTNPPEDPEILHRPHAFALIHGKKGAKVAYGELHWRVDAFTLQFKTSAIAVADHADHAHEHVHTHEHDHHHSFNHTHGVTSHAHTIPEDTGSYSHDHGGSTGSTVTNTGSPSTTNTDSPNESTTDNPNESTTSGVKATDGSTYGSGSLTHTVSGQITYCSGASQEAIGNITQQVPKYPTEDGTAMDPALNDTKYHELGEYGDVYLCWKADFEKAPAVTKCWVQIGVPAGSVVAAIGMGNTTTDRLDETPDDFAESTYYVKLGTVNEDASVIQKVSSDVVWTPTVMDRIKI